MQKYVLENAEEFQRLEKQSQNKFYYFVEELKQFNPKTNGNILDAGCGSGIVSRYLAEFYPLASVVGCDFSDIRVSQAKNAAAGISNLQFQTENLTQLSFENSSFDAINCRYVLEHLNPSDLQKVVKELYRCMRPNGVLCVIDIDGLLYNVHPKTKLVDEVLQRILANNNVNFNIGREIPMLLTQAGFSDVTWRVEPMVFQGTDLEQEKQLMKERFDQAMPFLNSITGNESESRQFVQEYLEGLSAPNAVLFYNKFIVQAVKQGLRK
jgi:ubiquinone/menaquinone biosynthesis C-methylase UbiE